MVEQKCVNCGVIFDSGWDCGSCTRYIPDVCNGKSDNEYCIDCCVKLGVY